MLSMVIRRRESLLLPGRITEGFKEVVTFDLDLERRREFGQVSIIRTGVGHREYFWQKENMGGICQGVVVKGFFGDLFSFKIYFVPTMWCPCPQGALIFFF